jgi:hypothetical protein
MGLSWVNELVADCLEHHKEPSGHTVTAGYFLNS